MANSGAREFAKKVFAAFNRYPITAETKELYTEKLSRWKMTKEQWDKALDRLIEIHTDESLPGLSEIYGHLKSASYENPASGRRMASAVFTLNGYDRLIRCVARDRNDGSGRIEWVIADIVGRDVHGQEIHLQEHVGEPVVNWIPENATSFELYPDDPPMPAPEDIPTAKEVQELVNATMGNLRRIG